MCSSTQKGFQASLPNPARSIPYLFSENVCVFFRKRMGIKCRSKKRTEERMRRLCRHAHLCRGKAFGRLQQRRGAGGGRGEMPSSAERQSQRTRPAAWLVLIGREGRVGLALAALLQLVGVSALPCPHYPHHHHPPPSRSRELLAFALAYALA
jgi:hypothetical protein